jgi:hypothetical protein
LSLEYYITSTAAGVMTMSLGKPLVVSAGASQTAFPNFMPGPSNEPGASVQADIACSDVVIYATSAGVPKSGEFDKVVLAKLVRQGVALTSGVAWTATLISGNVTWSGITGTGTGTLTLTGPTTASLAVESKIRLTATYQGITRALEIKVNRVDDGQTVTGGGGGGGSGTTVSTSVLGNTTSTSYDTSNAVSAELTVHTGATGRIDVSWPLSFRRVTTAVGSEGCFMKAQWRAIAGVYADFPGGEDASSSDAQIDGEHFEDHGVMNFSDAKTGLTASTDYNVRFLWREGSGGWRLAPVSGTGQAVGS